MGKPSRHNLDLIRHGLRTYFGEHGRTPPSSHDADPYVGYPSKWNACDAHLRKHGTSLARLAQELGYTRSLRVKHDREAIEKGVHLYYAEHGCTPLSTGDATKYVGYSTTWSACHWHLRVQGTSLSKLGQRLGYNPVPHNLEAIENGIDRYHTEHGSLPRSSSTASATPYIDYPTTWSKALHWLQKHHPDTYARCFPRHTLQAIKEGLRLFISEHGRAPSPRQDEDATPYVGYRAKWKSVQSWLWRKKNLSIHKLCAKRAPLRIAKQKAKQAALRTAKQNREVKRVALQEAKQKREAKREVLRETKRDASRKRVAEREALRVAKREIEREREAKRAALYRSQNPSCVPAPTEGLFDFLDPQGTKIKVKWSRPERRWRNKTLWSFHQGNTDSQGEVFACVCLDEQGKILREYRIPAIAWGSRRRVAVQEDLSRNSTWESYRAS